MGGLVLALVAAVVVAFGPGVADASADELLVPRVPSSLTKPPPGFTLSGKRAVAIANRNEKIRREVRRAGPLTARPYLLGAQYWLVRYYRGGRHRADVRLNGRTGRVKEARVGRELDWPPIASGNHGPDARRFHKLLILAGLLFLVPFLDPRRPWRLLHLDLLAIAGFGVSFAFAEAGNVYAATPLIYPPALYLVARLAGLALKERPADPLAGGRLTWMTPRAIGTGLVAVLALRYAYTLIDGHVNDVGYASVYGADSIIHGFPLYDSSPQSGHLDTYGPIAYLAYVPFTLLIPLKDLSHNHAQAAQAAAITFDFATVACLYVLGRRLRPGDPGRLLGLALAWGFATCPWTLGVLAQATNDGLVALVLVIALLAAESPLGRGIVIGLGAASKLAPLVLGGLFARVGRERGLRPMVVFGAAVVLTAGVAVLAYLPDGGLREFWDSTLGFQFSRSSPFGIWGLYPAWKPLHSVVTLLVAAMAAGATFLPRERSVPRLAAAGATLLMAAQLAAVYWHWFYLTWVMPYTLVALFSVSSATRVRNSGSSRARALALKSS